MQWKLTLLLRPYECPIFSTKNLRLSTRILLKNVMAGQSINNFVWLTVEYFDQLLGYPAKMSQSWQLRAPSLITINRNANITIGAPERGLVRHKNEEKISDRQKSILTSVLEFHSNQVWQHCSYIHLAMATKPFHLCKQGIRP